MAHLCCAGAGGGEDPGDDNGILDAASLHPDNQAGTLDRQSDPAGPENRSPRRPGPRQLQLTPRLQMGLDRGRRPVHQPVTRVLGQVHRGAHLPGANAGKRTARRPGQ